jgi:nitrogen regulatory protein PII-like uncharacterized protein
MEENNIIIEKDLISAIMSLPDTEEKKELIAYLVTEKIKKSIEENQVPSDTLKVLTKIEKGYFSVGLSCNKCTEVESGFKHLLYASGKWSVSDVKRDLIEKIANINELGSEVYKVFVNCEHFDSQHEKEKEEKCVDYFTYGHSRLRIPDHVISQLVKEEYVEEIAEFITEYLARLFLEYFKIPEVNEHIATYELPETVKLKLQESGIDPTFHVEYQFKKKKGPADLKLYVHTEISYKISRVMDLLAINNVTKDFVVINRCISLPGFYEGYCLNVRDLLRGPVTYYEEKDLSTFLFAYEYLNHDITQIVEETRKHINEEFKLFNETGYVNLLLSAMYKPLNYTEPTIEIPVRESDSGKSDSILIQNLHIERNSLFDIIRIKFDIKAPSEYNIEWLPINLNTVEGERYIIVNVANNRSETFSTIIKPHWNVVSSRISRLISGDTSVINEVEEIDRRMVNDIVEQFRVSIVKWVMKDEKE